MLSTLSYLLDLGLFAKLFLIGSAFVLAFVIFAFYQVYIRPKMNMKFYIKQGASPYFFPLIGAHKLGIGFQKTHGDSKYFYKTQAKNDPCRISVSNLGVDAIVLLNDPELIKEYFLKPENYVKDPIFLELYSELLGRGIITSEGPRWKKQRKILSSSFHFEFLRSIFPIIKETVHQTLYDLRHHEKEVNILDAFQNIAGQVVGKTFFGNQLAQHTFQGKPLTLGLDVLIGDLGQLSISLERYILGSWVVKKGFFPKHKKLMDSIKLFRNICSTMVQERKQLKATEKSPERIKDMLDLLLEYNGEEGKMSDEEIIDQFVSFFLAGMDSTGHVMTILSYFMHIYPEHRARMLEEAQKYYTKDCNIDDLNKLEFTMAFIKEILRFITPVPGMLPRKAVKDVQLKDITIKKGDLLDIEFFYNNFNSEYFDDPDTFNPERWMNKDKAINAYAFTPFSAGPRNCIGQHLALIELRVIIAEFLLMYDSKLKEGYEFRMAQRFLYEPEHPVTVTLAPKYN